VCQLHFSHMLNQDTSAARDGNSSSEPLRPVSASSSGFLLGEPLLVGRGPPRRGSPRRKPSSSAPTSLIVSFSSFPAPQGSILSTSWYSMYQAQVLVPTDKRGDKKHEQTQTTSRRRARSKKEPANVSVRR
jgi:hypothetical protein